MTDKLGAPDKTVLRLQHLGRLKTEIDTLGELMRQRFGEYAELAEEIHNEDQIASATKWKDEITNAAWTKFAYPSADEIPRMQSEEVIVDRVVG